MLKQMKKKQEKKKENTDPRIHPGSTSVSRLSATTDSLNK